MIKISELTPWKGGWSVTAASSLSGLALALAVGFASMSAMLQSDDALALNDCSEFPRLGSERDRTNDGPRGDGTGEIRPSGTCSNEYTAGVPRDDSDFPLTGRYAGGTLTAGTSDGNIVYNLRNAPIVQTYDHDNDADTAARPRPWWKADCTADSSTEGKQQCWTTVATGVTMPTDKTIYYRLVDDDGDPDIQNDYFAGPAAGTYGRVTIAGTNVIAKPGNTAYTAQVATQRVDPDDATALIDAAHNVWFIENSDTAELPYRIGIYLAGGSAVKVRGIKKGISTAGGIPEVIPRNYPTDGGQTYDGPDEDGFGRYAIKFDTTTEIGWRVTDVSLYFEGGAGQHSVVEGGANHTPIIVGREVDEDGGPAQDGGGIHLYGDAKRMSLRLGHLRTASVVRDTVIGRAKDAEFHAIRLSHEDTEREMGGTGELFFYDATVLMYNGGTAVPPGDQDRGMIVTTGGESNGITVSVKNPVGDADSDGDATGGIKVRVDTPVRIKTIGANSHGIMLNLGYGGTSETAIKAREKGAAVLLTADNRNTLLQIGLTEGTEERAANNRLTTAGYAPSVRIATSGDRSGGIVIRNDGGADEGGGAVNLVTLPASQVFSSRETHFPAINSALGVTNPADYYLRVDKPIVTMGSGSHGVVASIGDSGSGIMMTVDINGFRDVTSTDAKEDEVLTISTGPDANTKYRAFDGSGSKGRFTVNVRGHVKGDIVTGDGVVSDTDATGDTINVGVDETGDDNDWTPTITGDIDAGGGNDKVNVVKGTVNGMVKSGTGCDTVTLSAGVTVRDGVSLGGCNDGDKQNMLITPFNLNNVHAGGNTKLDLVVEGGTDRMFSTVKVLRDPNQGTARTDRTTVTVDGGTVTRLTSDDTGYNTKVVIGANNPVTIGAVALGGGHDTLDWVSDVGSIDSIDGGGGNDEVTLRSGTVTSMTGVETFTKMGAGTVMVGTMHNRAASSSSLSGSTADAGDPITVNVEQGRLVVTGLLQLGTGGTLTVKKNGFLSIDIGGMSTQRYEDDGDPMGTLSHGRIVGQVVMEAAVPQIELVSGSDADNAEAKKDTATTLSRLISGEVRNSERTDVKGSLNFTIGSEALPRLGTPGGNQAAAAADDDDNTAIYAVGALAVLWWVMRRDDMGGGSGLVDYESGIGDSSFAGHSGLRTYSSGAVKTWANYYSDSTAPVQGLAVGLEAPISSRGSFSFSAMPEAKGSLSLNTLSLNQKSSFQGGHYSVKGKWQSENYFAAAELSYADAMSSTSFDNSVAGGKLGGKFDMTNSHLEISAGTKVQLTDKVSVVPTVGVYGGSVSQSESVLTGRNVVARMSKQEQSYAGWNLGLRVRPDAWTAGGAEFQPNISWNTFRTSSDRHSVDLRQSDKAGVLDFSSQLPVQGMPAVVNAFRAGMTMKSETGLQLDLDYVGMEIDGELQHGAIARMQTRF